ncbi:MAG: hydantoinase/oxoprolinase family protein [Pseudomonadota bacterium]
MGNKGYAVGVDIGGTFTDLVAIDEEGNRTVIKTPSTPEDPSLGMVNALKLAAESLEIDFSEFLGKVSRICHGTTVTTNAVITRSGAKMGMLTTKGVRDTIEVRRGMRELEYLYDYTYSQPEPLCPRNLRIPIEERVQADGSVYIPLNEDQVRNGIKKFRKEGVEAIAICFLWSFRNPRHELRAAEICREEFPEAYLSLSHEVAPILGEYLRFQSTTINGYVGPIIKRYMTSMRKTLNDAGYKGALLIVTSSGGVMSPEAIMEKAGVTLTSGPATGPVAGIWYGDLYGIGSLITMDMGGTSFDTSLVKNREISIRAGQVVAGVYHIGLPTVDVHAIGAGGGTVAWLDEAGGIHVGPQSAGADPGPACYMKGGTEPTVTDANLVLGRLNPDYFVGGKIKLNKDASIKAIKKIAEPKGMTVEEIARAIITIAVVNMTDATEVITIRRGENPKDYGLLVGGGAGPGHAAQLAKTLEIKKVIIPRESSIFCAMGGIISDIRHDYITSLETPTEELDWRKINNIVKSMKADANKMLTEENVPIEERSYRFSADMKYIGQYHEIDVQWPDKQNFAYSEKDIPEIVDRFHERHETLYAHRDEEGKTFTSNLKLAAFGHVSKITARLMPIGDKDTSKYQKGTRDVWFEETGFTPTPIYDGDAMLPGVKVKGPCVIEQRTTTIVVPPEHSVEVSEYGDFMMNVPV